MGSENLSPKKVMLSLWSLGKDLILPTSCSNAGEVVLGKPWKCSLRIEIP